MCLAKIWPLVFLESPHHLLDRICGPQDGDFGFSSGGYQGRGERERKGGLERLSNVTQRCQHRACVKCPFAVTVHSSGCQRLYSETSLSVCLRVVRSSTCNFSCTNWVKGGEKRVGRMGGHWTGNGWTKQSKSSKDSKWRAVPVALL